MEYSAQKYILLGILFNAKFWLAVEIRFGPLSGAFLYILTLCLCLYRIYSPLSLSSSFTVCYILLIVLLVMHFLSFFVWLCCVSYSISQIADQCFGSGSGLDPDSIRSVDPGGQKWSTKTGKSSEISCFEVLDVLFWGLKASPIAWTFFIEA